MLKITAIDEDGQRTLVLEGKLTDPWVAELERTWTEARLVTTVRTVAVDLKDVTTISEQGKALLGKLMSAGAKVHCCRGVFTKHVLDRLMLECSGDSGKRL